MQIEWSCITVSQQLAISHDSAHLTRPRRPPRPPRPPRPQDPSDLRMARRHVSPIRFVCLGLARLRESLNLPPATAGASITTRATRCTTLRKPLQPPGRINLAVNYAAIVRRAQPDSKHFPRCLVSPASIAKEYYPAPCQLPPSPPSSRSLSCVASLCTGSRLLNPSADATRLSVESP
jgi:hypothetical protein